MSAIGWNLQPSPSPHLLERVEAFVRSARARCGVTCKPTFEALDRLQSVYRPVVEVTLQPAPWTRIVFTLPLDSEELLEHALQVANHYLFTPRPDLE